MHYVMLTVCMYVYIVHIGPVHRLPSMHVVVNGDSVKGSIIGSIA